MNDELLEWFSRVEKYHWWWEGRRRLLSFLLREEKRNIKILDVGCGTGETLIYMKKLFPKSKLWGVDISEKAVVYSKRSGYATIVSANATDLPFDNEKFDVVLMLDVLEHVKDHIRAMCEAERVLKDGGKVIVTVPALKAIWSKHDVNQGHFRRYSKSELMGVADKAELKVEFVSYFNVLLLLPIALIRIMGRLRIFRNLANYDNTINYEIANKRYINGMLTRVFVYEVHMIKHLCYPVGVSLVGLFVKDRDGV